MITKHVHDEKSIRSARLFRNGRSQAVRIPREFEFEGSDVTIRRDGPGRLLIEGHQVGMTPAEFFQWLGSLGPINEPWEDPTDDDLLPLDEIEF